MIFPPSTVCAFVLYDFEPYLQTFNYESNELLLEREYIGEDFNWIWCDFHYYGEN